MGWEVGCWRVAITCWLVLAAAESCRHGTRCSRRPCSGPCTWRCTSRDGEGAGLRSGPLAGTPNTPSSGLRTCPPHRPVSPRRRRDLPVGRGPRPVWLPGFYLLRIVQGAPRLPDALPEALVRHPLWGHTSAQLRLLSQGPRPPSAPPPARPRTCSSSCALATAICTFTCSMISPGSSFPLPELPKSEPKPPSISPQSQLECGRVRPPQPAPEVGRPVDPREMESGHEGAWAGGIPLPRGGSPAHAQQEQAAADFPETDGGPGFRAQAPPPAGLAARAHEAAGTSTLDLEPGEGHGRVTWPKGRW